MQLSKDIGIHLNLTSAVGDDGETQDIGTEADINGVRWFAITDALHRRGCHECTQVSGI